MSMRTLLYSGLCLLPTMLLLLSAWQNYRESRGRQRPRWHDRGAGPLRD
jgi:hypothetical protein